MLIPNYRIACIAIFVFLSNVHSFGQSEGWTLLENNHFIQAKKSFENQLNQNPNDENALCGMLFISEVVQDHLNYTKYANQLIESKWNDEYFALFKHLYEGTPEDILAQKLDASLLVKPTLALADSLFYYRKFDKSVSTIQSVTQQLNWSVIGAFDNVSGSGHIVSQPLEIESFKPERVYENENGHQMKWVQRHQSPPNGEVFFNENLAYMRNGTYYANTFITMPKDETIHLRIARSTPIKIWLDDDLVFDKNTNLKYWWDGEILEIPIKKGMHRILVKSSTYVEEASKSGVYLSFNDQYNEGNLNIEMIDDFGKNHFNNKKYEPRGNRSAGFVLRVTDVNGRLIENLESDFYGNNKTRDYEPELKEKQWIQILKNKIESNPKDLKNYYLLTKMYLLMELGEEGEEWLNPLMEEKNNQFYFKFLFAKLLASNDKGELAEGLLSDLDFYKTPAVAVLINQLQKTDKRNEIAKYHSKLRQILHFSPTHKEALVAYLNWLTNHGKDNEKKDYIRNFLAKYPKSGYRDLFLKSLTLDGNNENGFQNKDELNQEQSGLAAVERIKNEFNAYDYLKAIAYYKSKKNDKKVFKLYDELIEKFPYRTYYLTERGSFHFEKKEIEEAISYFEKALEIHPYHARTIEKLGDIYLFKKEETKAVEYFQQALDLDRVTFKGTFALDRMRKKINEIKGLESPTIHLQNFKTKEILADNNWKQPYKNEESIVLMYNIQAALNKDNRMSYQQKLWIKILNQAGANYWTEADFSFLGELSKVKVIKLDSSEVTPSRNWNLVVFQNLQPGDIIQIEGYSNGDMTREIPNEMYQMSWLSLEVPVYRSVFEMIVPKEKQLNYICNRIDCNPQKTLKDDHQIYKWENYHIQKNIHEEAVLDKMDKFAWVMMSTQQDWNKVVKWYEQKTYQRLEANYEVEQKLYEIVNDQMTSKEKVQAIYNYLTTEYTYSHVPFLNSNYIPKKPSQTITGGIGDCKDIASLMIAMLRELNIEAYYVLVRTKNYTHLEPRPSVLAFDHVVVGYILEDSVMRYVDLTTDYFSSSVLPEFDHDQWALLIKPRQNELFRLPNNVLDKEKNSLKIKTNAQITEERNMDMQVNIEAQGVIAGVWRETLNNNTTNADHLGFLNENLSSAEFDHLKIQDYNFAQLKNIDASLNLAIEMKAFHHVEKVSDFQILEIPILHPITTRTAMFGELRINNLELAKLFDLAPSEQLIDLEIPKGFELLEIPKNVILENKFGSYQLQFKKTPNGLQVQRRLIFKKHFVTGMEYPDFKKFYLKLLDADRTKLAIRKRSVMVKQN